MEGVIKRIKEKWEGKAPERMYLGDKVWGFRAVLSNDGRYRFDVDTKGCNLAQLGIIKILHERIGEVLKESVKEKEVESRQQVYKEDEKDGNRI